MDVFRLAEKNKMIAELASFRAKMTRAENALTELRKNTSISDRDYIEKQSAENRVVISTMKEKIEVMEARLDRLVDGEMDHEIMAKIAENTTSIRKMEENFQKKKEAKAVSDSIKKKLSEKQHKINKDIDYRKKQQHYDMLRSYERFCDIDCPPYIADSLKSMPNNRGYIWRGVWFFGELKADNGPCIMYEKQRDVTIVHEIFDNEHVIYRKVGRGPKEYVSSKGRRQWNR
jgi:hypothetical protein